MPRTFPGGLATHIESNAISLAYLFKLERSDGLILGFTDHDKTLTVSGVDYKPTDGMTASEVASGVGTGVDNFDVMGVLTDDRITEEDVDAGLWDGAEVYLYVCNSDDLTDGVAVEFRGFIGEIEQGTLAVRFEVRSLAQRLKQVFGWETEKKCSAARLGNAQCKFNLAGNTQDGTPARATKTLASGSGTSLVFSSDSAPTGHYTHGYVAFTSGANDGLERRIKSHTLVGGTAEIELRTPFPFAVSPGNTATLETGCDHLATTCVAKFRNYNNYHGQNELLGNDKVLKVGRPPG